MKTDEVRERFLKFFERQGHTIYPSDSLVPENDPSLLFTGAGMNQFKDMFLGRGQLPFKRATTSQKCLRTGDIERVGHTTKHHTFFEMLGNFSFGDYFKKEAIQWAWEFLTRDMNIPPDRLYVSVYEDDDEAHEIWQNQIKVPTEKIFRMGAADNFWPANAPTDGPNGPCGPCSEIYFDFGAQYGCGQPSCNIACSCNRYAEIWNLVFTQFDRQEDGTLAPLPRKNIDTGMGLERISAVMHGVPSNFDIDIFAALIRTISDLIHVKYDAMTESGAKIRRIADHIRAVTFCIGDGALPSNEDRGYVVRKILRIAVRDAISLGTKDSFMHKVVPVVAQVMGKAYPDVLARKDNIARIVRAEEEKFLTTVEQGMAILDEEIQKLKRAGRDTLSGEQAFVLYDTYGFPMEMTAMTLKQHALKVDFLGFEQAMERQRRQARAQTKLSADIFGSGPLVMIKEKFKPTVFLGYSAHRAEGTVLAIIKGNQTVDEAREGDEISILLDQTPFYGESGGQIGDTGTLKSHDGEAEIGDTTRPEGYFLHHGKVAKGRLKAGDKIKSSIDSDRRLNIMRNHTGTHILQSALRSVLGKHIEQAGSLVAPDRLRFDFTHFAPMTREEIRRVEDFVNSIVMNDLKVTKVELSMEEARRRGALMFFGEKYGDVVRTVFVGGETHPVSVELCGGTHLEHTGTIGLFKIISEKSIGSGIRRLEALTGPGALQYLYQIEEQRNELCKVLETTPDELIQKLKRVKEQSKSAPVPQASVDVKILSESAKQINGGRFVSQLIPNVNADLLRRAVDTLLKKEGIGAAILATEENGKQTYIIGVRQELVQKGLKAGDLARSIGALCGGGGGGKDHLAQAGGSDAQKIPQAFAEFEKLISEKLG